MMNPPWGMGAGMLFMLGALLLLSLAAVVLVLLLRRGVAGNPDALVRAGAIGRLDVPAAAPVERAPASASGEFEGFLVIPDISGYTEFMQMSAYTLAHAQFVVSALLSSVIEAVEPVLAAAKIEGDAVFFYGVRANEPGGREITGREVGEAVCALLAAFYRKRAELSSANACPCKACRHVDRLELKTVVHGGRFLLYDLRGQKELSGLPVIVAHRLLKSHIGLERYVLVTDAVRSQVTLPLETEPRHHVESYDGIGQMEGTVHAFPVAALLGDRTDPTPDAPSKASDAARKLVEGLRALRGLAGQA